MKKITLFTLIFTLLFSVFAINAYAENDADLSIVYEYTNTNDVIVTAGVTNIKIEGGIYLIGYEITYDPAVFELTSSTVNIPEKWQPLVGDEEGPETDMSRLIEDGKYFGSVEPTLFEQTTQPACVSVNHNLTILYHDTLGVLQLLGQGAGRYPTANAVVQDILDVYEEKWSNILIENEFTYDDSLSNTRLCICTSDEGLKVFDAYLVRKEQVGNRFYGWTMDLNNDVKCQLVKEASKKDNSFFYAVVR